MFIKATDCKHSAQSFPFLRKVLSLLDRFVDFTLTISFTRKHWERGACLRTTLDYIPYAIQYISIQPVFAVNAKLSQRAKQFE